MGVKYPNITVKLPDCDGHVFIILDTISRAMKRAKVPEAEILEFYEDSKSGDYKHLLSTCRRWVNVESRGCNQGSRPTSAKRKKRKKRLNSRMPDTSPTAAEILGEFGERFGDDDLRWSFCRIYENWRRHEGVAA